MPERRNESQTADPATVAASPRRAKMPAPTIAPIPRKIAPRTVTSLNSCDRARPLPLTNARARGVVASNLPKIVLGR